MLKYLYLRVFTTPDQWCIKIVVTNNDSSGDEVSDKKNWCCYYETTITKSIMKQQNKTEKFDMVYSHNSKQWVVGNVLAES